MDFYQIVTVTNFFLPVLLLIVPLFVFIPQSLREYAQWKKSRLTKHLSALIMLSTLSLYFLTTFYLICMNYLVRLTDTITTEQPLRILVLIGLILLAYYILIPGIINQYGNWKEHRKTKDLSLMTLFGFSSFLALTLFYIITIRYIGIFSHV